MKLCKKIPKVSQVFGKFQINSSVSKSWSMVSLNLDLISCCFVCTIIYIYNGKGDGNFWTFEQSSEHGNLWIMFLVVLLLGVEICTMHTEKKQRKSFGCLVLLIYAK